VTGHLIEVTFFLIRAIKNIHLTQQ